MYRPWGCYFQRLTTLRATVDKGARTYVQSPKKDPDWGHVARRVTMNLDDNFAMQGFKIQDQPIGCNYIAPLPNAVTNIRTRLFWEPPARLLIGQEGQRPRPRRVAFVDDDRLPPLD
eukprot:5526854-Pyramimonas_sp.AAC.1